MTLVIENGTGISNADSYAAISDADTYMAGVGYTAWAGLATSAKESALRLATLAIDDQERYPFLGIKKTYTQALQWPRIGVVERYGQPVPDNVLPGRVAKATMEMTHLIETGVIITPTTNISGNIKAKRTDVLEKQFFSAKELSESPMLYPYLPTVTGILSPLLLDTGPRSSVTRPGIPLYSPHGLPFFNTGITADQGASSKPYLPQPYEET